MLHTTLTGTIFIFQGEEMGMINVPPAWGEEEYKDVESVQFLQGERERLAREGADKKTIEAHIKICVKELRMTARDNGRTPIQVIVWLATFV
jgi:alpha-glucosidase